MTGPSMLRRTLAPLAALLALSLTGCPNTDGSADAALDQVMPDAADVSETDGEAGAEVGAEVGADASENLPRCNFPDGGAPANVVMQGRIQALSLCNFCHQDATPGAGDFTGQLAPRPGTMAYGTNLSPDMETGIGRLTDDEIARAARYAIGRDRRRLCAMAPFAATRLNDDNLCALIAYLRSLPPVRRAIPASTCAR